MPLSEETMAWVREAVLRAKTPGEAVMLVDILGRALARFPENQAALRALLATNPPAGVKSTVYRFIAPSGQPR
jgi:hypothetical protein